MGEIFIEYVLFWMTVHTISVETPKDVLRAARGKNATLPCSYQTSSPNRDGFIQWDKLLRSHTERVLTWTFSTKKYIYGELYQNRARVSNNAEQSDASITIDQLTMDDNGTYECSVSLMSDLGGVSKSRVHLLVLVPPSKPDCSTQGETVIGNDIQLTCQSKEGSPAPQYSWKSYNVQHQERQVAPASMNVALYAGIAGGVAAALVIIGIILYCCCCRDTGKAEDTDVARPNRAAYREPPEQLTELSRRQEEEGEDDYRHEDRRDAGRETPDRAGR
ncbi:hypothetical protein FD755_002259 [Muntiacus reevesi]|uniref:Ig-like domain-containing protein n=1 Tax=Muntiacus reevesi TaxID=9886 RepID=A0A5J5N5V8_MUNRE|nr:hypothetical protein FD755_002259 [Muntiacus reevesi]